MDKKIRSLLVKALKGSSTAYRKLGIIFLQGKVCKRDKLLAKLCLEKAAEMGDEQGYLLYYRSFLKKKGMIDADSYEDMRRDYYETADRKERRRLKRYLDLMAEGHRSEYDGL